MSEVYTSALLFLSGAAASFINVMAGGGSLITLGVMMLLGIDPAIANGTNRIGVLVGTGSGVWAFKTEKLSNLKESLILGGIAIPGAILGSYFSIQLSNIVFQRIIAVVMILVLITILFPKSKKIKSAEPPIKRSVWIYPGMFIVGLYGGFIQVGVGFILMALIRHLMQLDLIKTNMHKVFIIFVYTIPVLLIFGVNGKIHWMYALVMAVGNAIGSWVSVKLAVKKGEKFVKFVLAIAIVLMVIKLFMPQV